MMNCSLVIFVIFFSSALHILFLLAINCEKALPLFTSVLIVVVHVKLTLLH